MNELVSHPDELMPINGTELLAQARRGDVVVLDVRPDSEYRTAHLPLARSIPLSELQQRLDELPRHKPVVAYCRGPFCLMASEAVATLNKNGFKAVRLEQGEAEWRSIGLPLESDAA